MNRWLMRPRVLQVIALAVFACIALFQLPWSPAASAHFTALAGAPPFDERPAGYTLSGVLAAFHALGPHGLAGYAAYRAVDVVFPWLLCALVAAVMLRIDAARATMWAWLAAVSDTIENVLQFAILRTREYSSSMGATSREGDGSGAGGGVAGAAGAGVGRAGGPPLGL